RIAVVGAGQMGASHARVIAESGSADLAVIVDIDQAAATRLAERHGSSASTDLADAARCDAVVIAGSTSARMECVLPLLEAGRPLLVEKPFAPTLAQVDELLRIAADRDVPLMCGFVERFNAALRSAVQILAEPPVHLRAVRHSPPAPRIASSVVNDLMLHDLDLAQRLFGQAEALLVGSACLQPPGSPWNEIADATIAFGASGVATVSANRMGQRKVRSLMIHTSSQLVEVDLLRQDVTVYRNVSQEMLLSSGGMGYRSSTEVELPFVRHSGEPLSLQFAHFLDLVAGRADHVEERRQIRPPHVLAEQIEARSVR
ncbi:MAG: Gfo/Idh/MocA family oxidoreductase, partial [Ilumatobacteraceae bacterium]